MSKGYSTEENCPSVLDHRQIPQKGCSFTTFSSDYQFQDPFLSTAF